MRWACSHQVCDVGYRCTRGGRVLTRFVMWVIGAHEVGVLSPGL